MFVLLHRLDGAQQRIIIPLCGWSRAWMWWGSRRSRDRLFLRVRCSFAFTAGWCCLVVFCFDTARQNCRMCQHLNLVLWAGVTWVSSSGFGSLTQTLQVQSNPLCKRDSQIWFQLMVLSTVKVTAAQSSKVFKISGDLIVWPLSPFKMNVLMTFHHRLWCLCGAAPFTLCLR